LRNLQNAKLHAVQCSPNISLGDQIYEDEMDETCGTDGGEKYIETFGGNLKEGYQFEDLCLEARIILKIDLEEPSWMGVNWMNLFHDKGSWPLY